MATEEDYDYAYSNATYNEDNYRYMKFLEFMGTFLTCMYSTACIFGVLGNALVLIILIFYEKMKALSDVFLVSLAVADFCFLCTLPFWAYSAAKEWIFHTLPCKIIRGLYTLNLYGSMLTLTCITIDRYFAIVLATKAYISQAKRKVWGVAACILVWVISLGFALPQFIFSKEIQNDKKVCSVNYPSYHMEVFTEVTQMVLGFFCPMFIMLIFYSIIVNTLFRARGFHKHKSLRIILAIVVTFIITQSPYNLLKLSRAIDKNVILDHAFEYALIVTEAIAYFHSCLNPVLYFFIGVKFRKHLMKILKNTRHAKHKLFAKQWQTTEDDSSKTCTDTHHVEETSMDPL
ncbi:C-X-C chemokine receptor type 6 [Pogona vitticeps]|uniref:C-X-C chemokine receptor type 6 n=1 Tax=Pogona vitticeps TaxID=103695 RepID=A0A6J0UJI0_9SAUR|nr:C-X-C chemokine receptor type 6 [Pogona vitticeps]XP_020660244.1 C-X-C chemokine receptor type 6 [Pogona vitticeps]